MGAYQIPVFRRGARGQRTASRSDGKRRCRWIGRPHGIEPRTGLRRTVLPCCGAVPTIDKAQAVNLQPDLRSLGRFGEGDDIP